VKLWGRESLVRRESVRSGYPETKPDRNPMPLTNVHSSSTGVLSQSAETRRRGDPGTGSHSMAPDLRTSNLTLEGGCAANFSGAGHHWTNPSRIVLPHHTRCNG